MLCIDFLTKLQLDINQLYVNLYIFLDISSVHIIYIPIKEQYIFIYIK